jgi:hypothetical protein
VHRTQLACMVCHGAFVPVYRRRPSRTTIGRWACRCRAPWAGGERSSSSGIVSAWHFPRTYQVARRRSHPARPRSKLIAIGLQARPCLTADRAGAHACRRRRTALPWSMDTSGVDCAVVWRWRSFRLRLALTPFLFWPFLVYCYPRVIFLSPLSASLATFGLVEAFLSQE